MLNNTDNKIYNSISYSVDISSHLSVVSHPINDHLSTSIYYSIHTLVSISITSSIIREYK